MLALPYIGGAVQHVQGLVEYLLVLVHVVPDDGEAAEIGDPGILHFDGAGQPRRQRREVRHQFLLVHPRAGLVDHLEALRQQMRPQRLVARRQRVAQLLGQRRQGLRRGRALQLRIFRRLCAQGQQQQAQQKSRSHACPR